MTGGSFVFLTVVWAQAGKDFPDMRQEREIKVIRVGDAVRRAGQLKGAELSRGP